MTEPRIRAAAVISGALANRPGNGGGASVRMTWVTALRRLGFDVWFVEQLAGDVTVDADGHPVAPEHSVQVDYFRRVIDRFGLTDRCSLLDERGNRLAGAGLAVMQQVAAEAALLVNLGGHLRLPALLRRFRRKAYVDLDPGYTQFWHADGIDDSGLAEHDAHFTVGLNVGRAECGVPVNGIAWHPLPPPVVIDEWPAGTGEPRAFTTVASWRGPFGRIESQGRRFGLKAHEFRKFLELPAQVPVALEIALDIHPADHRDLTRLREHGWHIVDPSERVPDPDTYAGYIRHSGAEFSVAQGIYIETGSGWISDRTVRYLAAGRPALVQDTGIGAHLPLGEGLIAFRDVAQAVAGAESIVADYANHCGRARTLAAEYFDSDLVVGRLLERVL